MYGCVNEHRLGAMWLDEHPEQKLNYDILRRLSFYYLQNGVIPAVLTSQRMPPEAKPVHLQVRRKLLELLAKSRDRELWLWISWCFGSVNQRYFEPLRPRSMKIDINPIHPFQRIYKISTTEQPSSNDAIWINLWLLSHLLISSRAYGEKDIDVALDNIWNMMEPIPVVTSS